MTTTKKAAAAPGANAQKKESIVKPIKSTAFDFDYLTDRINDRSILKRHKDKLALLSKNPDFLEDLKGDPKDGESLTKIVLHFGDGFSSKYEIENPTLVNETVKNLTSLFNHKLNEVEAEISALQS